MLSQLISRLEDKTYARRAGLADWQDLTNAMLTRQERQHYLELCARAGGRCGCKFVDEPGLPGVLMEAVCLRARLLYAELRVVVWELGGDRHFGVALLDETGGTYRTEVRLSPLRRENQAEEALRFAVEGLQSDSEKRGEIDEDEDPVQEALLRSWCARLAQVYLGDAGGPLEGVEREDEPSEEEEAA